MGCKQKSETDIRSEFRSVDEYYDYFEAKKILRKINETKKNKHKVD